MNTITKTYDAYEDAFTFTITETFTAIEGTSRSWPRQAVFCESIYGARAERVALEMLHNLNKMSWVDALQRAPMK